MHREGPVLESVTQSINVGTAKTVFRSFIDFHFLQGNTWTCDLMWNEWEQKIGLRERRDGNGTFVKQESQLIE